MSLAFVSHPACDRHAMGPRHPEQPARLTAISDALRARGLDDFLDHREAPRASEAQLLRVHTARHLEDLRRRAPQEGLVRLDPDTAMGPGSLEAAWRAAGAAAHAVDLVMAGEAQRAWCHVRPPGHHAERDRAMGFCLLNNIAVAAAQALEVHGLQRVAIVDFDAHYGNGTAEIFAGDPRVLLASTYQFPLFPDLNPPTIPGQRINCPLPAGTAGPEFRAAVSAELWPGLEAFRPQLVLVSAGFDALAGDPLAGLALGVSDFAWITERLCELSAAHAGGRIVASLEGGYELGGLAACAAAHLEVLLNA